MLKKLLDAINIDNPGDIPAVTAEVCSFKKDEVITAIGEVEDYIYLIKEGGVKVFYADALKEYILDFWFTGDFFTSYVSFIQRSPSLTQITALSETAVERISYQQLEKFYQEYPKGNEIGRKMAERMYVHKTLKEIALISLTAEQRYVNLLSKSKNLIHEVSVKEIASYLGIEPESLSRIRRKIIS